MREARSEVAAGARARRARATRSRRAAGALVAVLVLAGVAAPAEVPLLYTGALHESPVSGSPGDLLQLTGDGLDGSCTVVYTRAAVSDTGLPPSIPERDTQASGVAPIVSAANAPRSIIIRLPPSVTAGQVYRLWVRNRRGQWGGPALINDPRPGWFSPASVYATARVAGLPRELRLVGRNLRRDQSPTSQIRLSGPQGVVLVAGSREPAGTSLGQYVVDVQLPARLAPGRYRIAYRRSDWRWVDVPGQTLTVMADPPARRDYPVAGYGCAADARSDATGCVLSAMRDAALTGGRVVFDRGTWRLDGVDRRELTSDGIVVPVGVGLVAREPGQASVVRGRRWADSRPLFALTGANLVSGLRFQDEDLHRGVDGFPVLQIGRSYPSSDTEVVRDVTVADNIFDKTYSAIGDGGVPMLRVYVVRNVFGPYAYGLLLEGNGGNVRQQFTLEDSIVRYNRFYAGSLYDHARSYGPIASQVGAARRMDFSDNLVDGSSTEFLNDPQQDARGWRGALFFTLRGNIEHALIASNRITCAGDKIGDGEAIVFDNNHNAPGFDAVAPVTGATADSVSTTSSLRRLAEGQSLPGRFYVEHYVQVVSGRGLGQVRRIVAYREDAGVVVQVSPNWDVLPDSTSRIAIAREVWDAAVVGNQVDQRVPLCTKANATKPSGGAISYYSNPPDSVIDGNTLFDTSGISLAAHYLVADPQLGKDAMILFQYFVDIRNNRVDGEYLWNSDYSWSGISVGYAASPTAASPLPVASVGAVIAHNLVHAADAMRGGGIALLPTWHEGPGAAPQTWEFIESPLLFGNELADIAGPEAVSLAKYVRSRFVTPRVGVSLADGLIWNAVLSGNRCSRVDTPLRDGSRLAVRICDARGATSCECR